MNVSNQTVFAKIGVLVIENDALRERIAELEKENQRLTAENERLNAVLLEEND